jgi:hypothetical protein
MSALENFNPWEDHGKIMGRSWEDHGKIMGRSWEDHGKIMGRSWEDVLAKKTLTLIN